MSQPQTQYGTQVVRDRYGRGILRIKVPQEEVRAPSVVTDGFDLPSAPPIAAQRFGWTASQRGPAAESTGAPNIVEPYARGRAGEVHPIQRLPLGSDIAIVGGFGADSSGRQMSAQEVALSKEMVPQRRKIRRQRRYTSSQLPPFNFPGIASVISQIRRQVATRLHERSLIGQILRRRR